MLMLWLVAGAAAAATPASAPSNLRQQAAEAERMMKDGQFQQAYELANRVLNLSRKQGAEERGTQFRAEYVMGKCEQERGQLPSAEQHMLNAVKLCLTPPSTYAPQAVLPLMELGDIYKRQGRYSEAERYLLNGLGLRVKCDDRPMEELATIFEMVGEFYLDAGDPNRAEIYLVQAHKTFVEALGANHPRLAITLDLTGRMNRLLGEYALAERCFQDSLSIRSRAQGSRAGLTVSTLHMYARLKADQNDFAAAYELQTRALQQLESLPNVNGGTLAAHLNNLGSYAMNLSRTDEARRLLTRARDLSARHDGPRDESVGNTDATLAMIELGAGRIDEALRFLTESRAIYTERLMQVEKLGTEDQMQNFMTTKIQGKTDLAVECGAVASNNARVVRFAYETLLRRKCILAESIGRTLRASRERTDADTAALRKRLSELRSELSHMALVAEKPMDHEEASRLFKLEYDITKTQRNLAPTGRQAAPEDTPYATEIAQVAGALPGDSVLVEYAIFRRADLTRSQQARKQDKGECAAFVLLPDGRLVMRVLGRVSDIEPNLLSLRMALTRPGGGQNPDAEATAVARQLIHPLNDLLAGAKRILIAPDGILHLVPFSVLPDLEGNALLQKHSVAYLNTGRDLLSSPGRRSAATPPVIIARPSYDGRTSEPGDGPSSGMHFSDLPGTADEATAVTKVLRGARVLDRESASEANVKGLQRPAILHIATHGFFLDTTGEIPGGLRALEKLKPRVQNPPTKAVLPDFQIYSHPLLRCGLAFAGANQFPASGQDGILSAMEVLDMDLTGTELVVLSACETGIGATVDGSGVFGLRRAFLEAGAGAQVLSLWKVHDQATCMLMTRFYENLLKGLDKGEALRRAQQAVRDRQPEWKHPFYWAAFVVSGDWRPLRYVPSAGGREKPE